MLFEVRDANAGDVASLTSIHAEAWRASGFGRLTGEQLENVVAKRCTQERWNRFVGDSIVLLAEANGTPGGLAQLVTHDDGRGEVVRMYVLPELWGTGMAQALMAESLGRFRAMGVGDLIVFSADTPRALRFYEKCGFEPTGNSHEAILYDDVSVTDYEYAMTL